MHPPMLVIFVLLGVCALNTNAQTDIAVPSGSTLLEQTSEKVGHYRLVLSELKRTRATTHGEIEQKLAGHLWRRVWAMEGGLSLDEVRRFIWQQISPEHIIYQCQSLDCGSSHFWANEIFHNARLVTREKNQRYLVSSEKRPDGQYQTWVVYIVQRAAGQILVNIDQLVSNRAITALTVDRVHDVLNRNSGWLPGFVTDSGMLDEHQSASLIQALIQLSDIDKQRLYLIVHCYQGKHMADNMLCSERLAKQLRVATFKGSYELNILGQGALSEPPESSLKPALRYVYWPKR